MKTRIYGPGSTYCVDELEQLKKETRTSFVYNSWIDAIEKALIASTLNPKSFFIITLNGIHIDSIVHNGQVYE